MRKWLRRAPAKAPILTFATVAALAAPPAVAARQAVLEPDTVLGSYQVGTALPPLDPGRTLVEMTLEEAVERATPSDLQHLHHPAAPVVRRTPERELQQ